MTRGQIRKLRKKLGLTQQQFALVLGCTHHTVESYEQGKRSPNEYYENRLDTLMAKVKQSQKL